MAEERRNKPGGPQLRLRPFRAMRFDARVVGDIGEVTSPPYDVMDRRRSDDLLNRHPRNIVRLILPWMVTDPIRGEDPYARSAKLLHRWRHRGVLRTDDRPALYVYEYGDADHVVCGLVGALDLRKRDVQVVLPHEDVIPAIVADRLAMMATARANLEPILLVYDGDGSTRKIIDEVRREAPIMDVAARDETFHRVWAITDPGRLKALRQAIAPHQALIADGHHRYATYLQLRRRHRALGDGKGPWDRGLTMLIDQSQFPLALGPIHRSVGELPLSGITAPEGFAVTDAEPVKREPEPPGEPGEFVVTDGDELRRVRLVADRDPAVSDAELLHERLLPAWGATDDQIGYTHRVDQTVHNARQDNGVAVLLYPTTVNEVLEVARAGKMMPRKSTSFGPKPRMGLLMRAFDDE